MMSISSRREFLKQSLLGAAAWRTLAAQKALDRAAAPKKVIVAGAGMAGLVAAYELTQAGHDVTILEARTRPGGRVFTLREPFSDGLFAETGAARIPDNHDLTLRYAKLFGLTLDPFYPGSLASIQYILGTRVRVGPGEKPEWPLDLTAEEKKLGPPGLWQKYVVPVMPEVGDPKAAGWPPALLKKYDQATFQQFLRGQGASAGAVALMTLGLGMDDASGLFFLRDYALGRGAKGLVKIRGGNDQLPKAFAARLAEKTRYGSPVVRIEHDARGVRVVVQQAGSPQTMSAQYLICTIPFPVLRRVEISPALPPEKRRAVEELHYTAIARVYLQSRQRYWLQDGLNGFALTDHPMEIWAPMFDQPGARGILLSYIRGPLADRVTAMPEADRGRFGVEEIGKVFPGIRENVEGSASWCWNLEEWSRGAAAEFHVGQMARMLPNIARPEGRVHFAGDHTSAQPGWMQGALESGLRAAREIHQAA